LAQDSNIETNMLMNQFLLFHKHFAGSTNLQKVIAAWQMADIDGNGAVSKITD
jgi:hypothetical protein